MTGHQIPSPKFHPQMWKAVLEGRKCATTRKEPFGEPGDWWEQDGARYRIVDVMEIQFGTVANDFYRVEGFTSPEPFQNFWERIHRGNLPDPWEMRYIHFFARIAEGVEP
jgi:hypothetical protein